MEDEDRPPFARRLIEARKHAGLSQPQLAKLVPMAQSTLAGLEVSGAGSQKTAQIAQACGVRPEWLATGEGPMKEQASQFSPEAMEGARALDAMPKQTRALMVQFIKQGVATAKAVKDLGQTDEDDRRTSGGTKVP